MLSTEPTATLTPRQVRRRREKLARLIAWRDRADRPRGPAVDTKLWEVVTRTLHEVEAMGLGGYSWSALRVRDRERLLAVLREITPPTPPLPPEIIAGRRARLDQEIKALEREIAEATH